MDRQDIDALLVGSLYGELTPAEAERLAQHLESHPADKAALADMSSARRAVQDSRILARSSMAEPPQAISALLLQEAHRRAPRTAVAREPEETEGWLARFLKSFVSHPAMAAAVMLVLVIGTAGIIKMRHGSIGADEKASSSDSAAAPSRTAMSGSSAAVDPAGALHMPVPPAETGADAGYIGGDLGASAGSGMTVSLDDTLQQAQLAKGNTNDKLEVAKGDEAKPDSDTRHATGITGITVHTQQPTVKELPEDSTSDDAPAAPAKVVTAQTFATPPPQAPPAHGASNGAAVGNAGGGEGAPAADGETARSNRENSPGTGTAAAPNAPPTTPANSPPPPPPQNARKDSSKNTPAQGQEQQDQQKAASNASLVAWADAQHKRLVQLVQGNDCTTAVDVALSIQSRAPDYYAQNVANDRAVSSCMAYVNQALAKRAADAAQKAQRTNNESNQKK